MVISGAGRGNNGLGHCPLGGLLFKTSATSGLLSFCFQDLKHLLDLLRFRKRVVKTIPFFPFLHDLVVQEGAKMPRSIRLRDLQAIHDVPWAKLSFEKFSHNLDSLGMSQGPQDISPRFFLFHFVFPHFLCGCKRLDKQYFSHRINKYSHSQEQEIPDTTSTIKVIGNLH